MIELKIDRRLLQNTNGKYLFITRYEQWVIGNNFKLTIKEFSNNVLSEDEITILDLNALSLLCNLEESSIIKVDAWSNLIFYKGIPIDCIVEYYPNIEEYYPTSISGYPTIEAEIPLNKYHILALCERLHFRSDSYSLYDASGLGRNFMENYSNPHNIKADFYRPCFNAFSPKEDLKLYASKSEILLKSGNAYYSTLPHTKEQK